MTDEAGQYIAVGGEFAGHGSVNHSIEEYVRGGFWHTNTVENYFSILKRGMTGTYHHVSQKHLKRYLGEFDFRYNERVGLNVSDAERADKVLKGIESKRLTYRRTGEGARQPAPLDRRRSDSSAYLPKVVKCDEGGVTAPPPSSPARLGQCRGKSE